MLRDSEYWIVTLNKVLVLIKGYNYLTHLLNKVTVNQDKYMIDRYRTLSRLN